MKAVMAFIVCLVYTGMANALNTVDYVTIKELKSWSKTIDVYFSDNQMHQCFNSALKTRFVADAAQAHHVSFLLSAFVSGKPVQLAYECDASGHPKITGIRVR